MTPTMIGCSLAPSMSLLATHSAKDTQAERVGLTAIGVVIEDRSSVAEEAV
jgi:hypothetical protein